MNKKNIIIIVLSILTLFLIAFSHIKAKEAEKFNAMVMKTIQEARHQATLAEEMAAESTQNMHEARKHAALAEEIVARGIELEATIKQLKAQLAECKKVNQSNK